MHRRQHNSTKCTRIERLAQLSEQEIVIEKKKREIQAKIEAQKKKETEEALKKLESASESKTRSPSYSTKTFRRRYDFQRNSEREKNKEKEKEKDKEIEKGKEKDEAKFTTPVNAFSNDGSFMDQFKKLSSTGLKPNNVDIETLAKARKKGEEEKGRGKKLDQELENRDKEKEFDVHRQRRESDQKDSFCGNRDKEGQCFSEALHRSPTRKPLDSNIQLQLPPPGVVQLVPQHQVQMVAPQIVSVVGSMPVVPTLPSHLQSVQNQISTVPPIPQVGLLHQVVLGPPVHSFTTNQIQLQAVSGFSPETPRPVQSPTNVQPPCPPLPRPVSPPRQLTCIRPPLPMAPQNIPPPSPIQVQNIPPPPLPPKKFEDTQPKITIGNISLSFKKKKEVETSAVGASLDLGEIPTPPPPPSSTSTTSVFDANHLERKKKRKKRKTVQMSVSGCSPPPPGYFEGIPIPDSIPVRADAAAAKEAPKLISRVSPALSGAEANNDDDDDDDDEVIEEGKRHLAVMVARCGDEIENLLWIRNQDDPALRFLTEKDSKDYKSYRKVVLKYRKHPELLEKEESSDRSNSSPISDPTDSEEEPAEKKKKRSSPSKSLSDGSKSDSKDSADVNFSSLEEFQLEKDEMTLKKDEKEKVLTNDEEKAENTVHSLTSNSLLPEEAAEERSNKIEVRRRKRKSRWGDAIADGSKVTPLESANIELPHNASPSLVQPATKTPLLSKITRTDPGLIQYARKTFGSTNLSEEEWKKAEDHYKINLLYQDMVKKRAEIDRLERAGKFKYEYDSDEDVEGGTWEHKLRQQEMEATQLWAEELTRQAAGKHHIGDFLPPEELEKFMERYNAVKEGREPDLSDYKEYKLKDDNIGYKLLQKMGWNEGQGLGQDGSGITHPVNKASTRNENQGLGIDRPDGVEAGDDEYDAYRKRMMLAYRFRPNPLNNPRRPYY